MISRDVTQDTSCLRFTNLVRESFFLLSQALCMVGGNGELPQDEGTILLIPPANST